MLLGTVFQGLTDWWFILWWGLGTVGSLEFVFGKERWAVRFPSRHTALCARKPLWKRMLLGLWSFARTELQRADTIGDGSSDSQAEWYESRKNTTAYFQKRMGGDELCTAVETPSRKVNLTHFTDDDKFFGLMKDAGEERGTEVINQCMPLLEMIQGQCVQLCQRMTSMEKPCQRRLKGLGHR